MYVMAVPGSATHNDSRIGLAGSKTAAADWIKILAWCSLIIGIWRRRRRLAHRILWGGASPHRFFLPDYGSTSPNGGSLLFKSLRACAMRSDILLSRTSIYRRARELPGGDVSLGLRALFCRKRVDFLSEPPEAHKRPTRQPVWMAAHAGPERPGRQCSGFSRGMEM